MFGKSREAVHKAIRLGRVHSLVDLWFANRSLRLFSLRSAMAYWGRGDDFDFDKRLGEWRSEARLLYLSGQTWNVLHPKELVYLTYPVGEIA